MNDRELVWSISHDIIQMFGSDFGPFKGMAEKVMFDKIQEKKDSEIEEAINIIATRLKYRDVKNAKSKR